MSSAPASVRTQTRDKIRAAFYRIGLLETEKQYAYAVARGFDLSPVPGGSTLPSFLNLSEAEAQRLLALLEAAGHDIMGLPDGR